MLFITLLTLMVYYIIITIRIFLSTTALSFSFGVLQELSDVVYSGSRQRSP